MVQQHDARDFRRMLALLSDPEDLYLMRSMFQAWRERERREGGRGGEGGRGAGVGWVGRRRDGIADTSRTRESEGERGGDGATASPTRGPRPCASLLVVAGNQSNGRGLRNGRNWSNRRNQGNRRILRNGRNVCAVHGPLRRIAPPYALRGTGLMPTVWSDANGLV